MLRSTWLTIIVAVAACDGSEGPDAGLDPRLSVIQTEVFTPSCALSSCHDASGPEAGLDLSDGAAHASLVDVDAQVGDGVRVIPGDPDNSLLLESIEGTAAPMVRQMPIGLELEQDKRDVIRQWIEDGAAND